MAAVLGYRIIDGQTGRQVGKDYGPRAGRRAHARANRLDLDYGAIRYHVRILWSE